MCIKDHYLFNNHGKGENSMIVKNNTSGNFYYVQPLSLYLSTSAILIDNYYSLFSYKIAKVLLNWLIGDYLD